MLRDILLYKRWQSIKGPFWLSRLKANAVNWIFFSINTYFHLSDWALTLKFVKGFSIVAIFKTEKVK